MPTNRKRKTRESKSPLTKPERHLLLTGDTNPPRGQGTWRDQGESLFRTLTISRGELKALWEKTRDELLAAWKAEKKRGLPWGAKEFDKKGGTTDERT
ncbi:MAG: hypothetical protein V2B13_18385 [Pseudomonadota bacterium]